MNLPTTPKAERVFLEEGPYQRMDKLVNTKKLMSEEKKNCKGWNA